MAGAKVSVSYDDGATWKSAKVLRKDSNTFQPCCGTRSSPCGSISLRLTRRPRSVAHRGRCGMRPAAGGSRVV